MKSSHQDIKNFAGFEYITIMHVPIRVDENYGTIIDFDYSVLERIVAIAIIKESIPLRGKELKFLRKVLGLSLEKFGRELALSPGTILTWEERQDKQLDRISEVGVRAFLAEKFNIDIQGHLSKLISGKVHDLQVAI